MGILRINGDTSGYVQLNAPAVAGTTNLTLPLNGFGKMLQVVAATYSTQASSSSSTWADTGLTASITPSSTSSKVLVLVNQSGVYKTTGNTAVGIRIQRGASTIATLGTTFAYTATTASNSIGSVCGFVLDSPATISTTIYSTQYNSWGNIASAIVQSDNAQSSIVLIEVGP